MYHGKLKLDDIGGVIKSLVSEAVTTEKGAIREASEFYSFCQESLTLKNKRSSRVENRKLILVESD